ncbi:MAG: Uncharacterized protein CI948_1991 [Halanaerobium sp.]|nr:MAG: Uncharacterized protein CI948_1991 [Halanaerobium sp.]
MVKVKSLERDKDLENVELPEEVEELLAACPKYIVAHNEQQLVLNHI